jgi:leader peptidase (prepilin peptidase)/N-methyltransferase
MFGRESAWLALVYAVFLAGLITATFIDFEHFIIPDEITVGGTVVGFVCSFLLPSLHSETLLSGSLRESVLGIVAGAGIIYGILRLGKLLFGRQKLMLPADTTVIFTEHAVHLPQEEIPYEDLFYRQSDAITFHARTVELADRCYQDVQVRLTPASLRIGDEQLVPEEQPHMEAVSAEILLPREVMGLGDVKFMAAIGAFLGWKGVVFSLMLSSMIGSVVGVTLIVLRKREWSSRLPYGPYIALAAAIWVFGGQRLVQWWFGM